MQQVHINPNKRRRVIKKKHDVKRVIPHPHNVKPYGNYYIDSIDDDFKDSRVSGLGALFPLEDTLLISLFEFMTAQDLSRLSQVSKVLHIFLQEDDIWKHLTIQNFKGDFEFLGSWQKTYKKAACPTYVPTEMEPIRADYFYSELLYHSWKCLSANLLQWCKVENVDRRENLSVEDFIEQYEKTNKPVVITDIVTKWPAFTEKRWTRESLLRDHGDKKLYINAGMSMTLKDFFKYCETVEEENPAYLFDPKFGEVCPQLLKDYEVPKYFEEDFFSTMNEKRPSYRWFLAGPVRSGATFHKDPNHTSAWNACVVGHKKVREFTQVFNN